ncbi:NADH:flavin oxidoreductase/NADH oxidase [Nakamurella deserti]|uniref:NADH:flavin oxidoreductase/NADH oxidase n=1 Tax=Nakamurella deserti TaxID=2164074 RepID=UPI000DBE987A|nr:NADH:flavin oxidoreductase/NADH oxidase [Nakamurella deserti]
MSLLFSPLTLRGTTFANRVWLAPMCQYSAVDGVVNDWHLVHLGARATGGFGLLLTEAAAVLPEGRISPQDAGLWNDDQTTAWARVVEFVHGQGARIGVQLAHAGRKASTYRPWSPTQGSVPVEDGGWPTVGPSDVAFAGYRAPAELSEREITDIVAAFADAAVRADRAGFDVVELHAAHGYLLHQFLSPRSNLRTDAWGGDLAGRSRLLLQIVHAVRDVWGDKPLLVRLSGTDWVDGGWDVEQTTELSGWLAAAGVDLIDMSSGGNEPASIPVGPGYQVPLAAEVRHRVDIPVGAVGLITEPQQAEQILADGEADVVLLARAALRDPSWPFRAAHELGLDHHEIAYPPQYRRGSWPDRVPAGR